MSWSTLLFDTRLGSTACEFRQDKIILMEFRQFGDKGRKNEMIGKLGEREGGHY